MPLRARSGDKASAWAFRLQAALAACLALIGVRPSAAEEPDAPPWVVITYDVSGSLAYKYVSREAHARAQNYVRKIMLGPWLGKPDDPRDQVACFSGDCNFQSGILSRGAVWSAYTFGESVGEKRAPKPGAPSPKELDALYPQSFPASATHYSEALKLVGKLSDQAAMANGQVLYWIFVSDDQPELGQMGSTAASEMEGREKADHDQSVKMLESKHDIKPILDIKVAGDGAQKYNNQAWFTTVQVRMVSSREVLHQRFEAHIGDLAASIEKMRAMKDAGQPINRAEIDKLAPELAALKAKVSTHDRDLEAKLTDVQRSFNELTAAQPKPRPQEFQVIMDKRGLELKKFGKGYRSAKVNVSGPTSIAPMVKIQSRLRDAQGNEVAQGRLDLPLRKGDMLPTKARIIYDQMHSKAMPVRGELMLDSPSELLKVLPAEFPVRVSSAINPMLLPGAIALMVVALVVGSNLFSPPRAVRVVLKLDPDHGNEQMSFILDGGESYTLGHDLVGQKWFPAAPCRPRTIKYRRGLFSGALVIQPEEAEPYVQTSALNEGQFADEMTASSEKSGGAAHVIPISRNGEEAERISITLEGPVPTERQIEIRVIAFGEGKVEQVAEAL